MKDNVFSGQDGHDFDTGENNAAAVEQAPRAEDLSKASAKAIEEQRIQKNEKELENLDKFTEKAQAQVDEVQRGGLVPETLEERMTTATNNHDKRLMELMHPRIGKKKIELEAEEVQRLKAEYENVGLHIKVIRYLRQVWGPLEKPDFAKRVSVSNDYVLKRVIDDVIKAAEEGVISLGHSKEKISSQYKTLRETRGKALKERNEIFDTYQGGTIKLRALEEQISHDSKLRNQYLEEREKQGYDGRYDSLLEDVEQKIQGNEEKREKLMDVMNETKRAAARMNDRHSFLTVKAKEFEGHRNYFDMAYDNAKDKIERLNFLRNSNEERASLFDAFKTVAVLNGSPLTTICSQGEELMAEFLNVVFEDAKKQGLRHGYSNPKAMKAIDPLTKLMNNCYDEAIAEIAKDRFVRRG